MINFLSSLLVKTNLNRKLHTKMVDRTDAMQSFSIVIEEKKQSQSQNYSAPISGNPEHIIGEEEVSPDIIAVEPLMRFSGRFKK